MYFACSSTVVVHLCILLYDYCCVLVLTFTMSYVRKRLRDTSVDSTSSATCSLYIDHRDCYCVCRYCGELFWFAERIASQSTNGAYVYN